MVRVPGQAPHLLAWLVVLPLLAQFGDRGCVPHVQARQGQVLDVLGEQETSRVQDEDAVGLGFVGGEQVLGEHAAERAAPDDHNVKGSGVRAVHAVGPVGLLGAEQGFVQAVTGVAAHDVARKVGVLGRRGGGHGGVSLSAIASRASGKWRENRNVLAPPKRAKASSGVHVRTRQEPYRAGQSAVCG
jgi:hypothetical protein